MEQLKNVALHKKATQSSLAPYSHGATPELDAALAVNGNLKAGPTFHTDREWNPWWEVDLGDMFSIHLIRIFNRFEESHRFCNFSILTSPDHESWEVVFSKCDPRKFMTIDIPFKRPVTARYVRVRSDTNEFLHLRQVEIYGEPAEQNSSSQKAANEGQHNDAKTIFSVLFNESPSYLQHMVNNFLHFTPESTHFIINLSTSFEGDIDSFEKHDRVSFIRAGFARKAFGASLLLGHLESVSYADINCPGFDYFVPISSNSLFIKMFDVTAAVERLTSQGATEWYVASTQVVEENDAIGLDSDQWWWKNVNKQKEFLRYLKDDLTLDLLVPHQIEGLFAPFAQWRALATVAKKLQDVSARLEKDSLFPLEEILPSSYFQKHFNGNYTSICQVLWHPFRTIVRMEHLIQPSWFFPKHIFIAKWFEREIEFPETAAVASEFEREVVTLMSRSIELDDLESLSTKRDFFRRLAEALDVLLVEKDGFILDRLPR